MQDQEYQDIGLAFLGSLVPGIIHNLATPLSGVLGATQLLEKRVSSITDLLRDLDRLDETERNELIKQFDRNRTNVDILAKNARHLADILQVIVQRINRGNSTVKDSHCINELLQSEIRFLEANLTFKHKVKKQISLGSDTSAAKFVYGHVANVIDEYVTCVLAAHDLTKGLIEMDFTTTSTETHVQLIMEARYQAGDSEATESDVLAICLERLQTSGWSVQEEKRTGYCKLCLSIPRRLSP